MSGVIILCQKNCFMIHHFAEMFLIPRSAVEANADISSKHKALYCLQMHVNMLYICIIILSKSLLSLKALTRVKNVNLTNHSWLYFQTYFGNLKIREIQLL